MVLATGSTPRGILVDGANVVWAENGSGTIRTIPTGGGTPVTLASGQGCPWHVAADSTAIYWGNACAGGGVSKLAK